MKINVPCAQCTAEQGRVECKLAAGPEEAGEEKGGLWGEEAGCKPHFVVEHGVVEDGEDRPAGPGFGVWGGVDEAGDAGVEEGAGAHGAGLEGGVEGAACEAVIAEGVGRRRGGRRSPRGRWGLSL